MTDDIEEIDEEAICEKCGSDRTHLTRQETIHGEVIFQYCEDCGYQWNHG